MNCSDHVYADYTCVYMYLCIYIYSLQFLDVQTFISHLLDSPASGLLSKEGGQQGTKRVQKEQRNKTKTRREEKKAKATKIEKEETHATTHASRQAESQLQLQCSKKGSVFCTA